MVKKKETKAKKYQKSVSKGIVSDHGVNTGSIIAQIYRKTTFDNNVSTVEGVDVSVISKAIREQEVLLAKGDLTSLENMLLGQTHTLNSLFGMLVGKMSIAEQLKHFEVFGRLALKAQNQTRQTASTLAEIKGVKKTTFIHQLNNAQNQQVNNGASKKLNKSSNERVINDVDASSETISTRENQSDETLALPENTGRKSTISHECNETRDAVSAHNRAAKTVG